MYKDLLLDWYDANRRSFPWRERKFTSTDEHAYHTWVCEVMSQQTLLSVLIPKYNEFLTELPTVKHLHECSEEKLRYLWKGLGYYARARNLQKGAHQIMENLGGVFPTTKEGWQNISGCGSYTSSIIASICFGEMSPSVDGNVIRVASRLQNIQDNSVWTQKGHLQIFEFFKQHISAERPGDFNQALMDLGATVCKKQDANCIACPFKKHCLAYKNGTTHLCPPTKPRPASITENIYALLVQNPKNNEQIGVLERNKGFLKKTIGFPLGAEKDKFSYKNMLHIASTFGGNAQMLKKTFTHSITKHKITGHVIVIKAQHGKFSAEEFLNACSFENKIQWIDKSILKNGLSSSLDQKSFKIFLSQEN